MSSFPVFETININGQIMDFSSPKVMGIVNLTADSFYDGGKIKSDKDLLTKVEKMMAEGVDILDVGAYSSRPGAIDIPVEQESSSALGGIASIVKEHPNAMISIDTFRSGVARKCLDAGASIVNDISGGGLDDQMFGFIAERKVPYIMMHMRGNPRTMKELTDYDDLLKDIIDYFQVRIADLNERGVTDIVIDPGFGFAKTKEQSFELLGKLDLLKMLGRPMLCGVSRKSMIFMTLETTPDEALTGTIALNMACLMNGGSILRVHDVKEAKETIKMFDAMKSNGF